MAAAVWGMCLTALSTPTPAQAGFLHTSRTSASLAAATLGPPSGLIATHVCGATLRQAGRAATPATSSSITVAAPATATGDIVIAALATNGSATVTAPPGFSLLGAATPSASLHTSLYYATSPAAGSYTWSWTGGNRFAVVVLASYLNVAQIDTSSVAGFGSASTAVTAPSVSASAAGARLVVMTAHFFNASSSTPAGMTARSSQASPPATGMHVVSLFDQRLTAIGATGTRTATGTAAGVSVAASVLLTSRPRAGRWS